MKLKENFVLRSVADSWYVLALGEETINFNGMLSLNSTAVKLWHLLEQGKDRDELASALVTEYNIGLEQALEDVDEFYARLVAAGCAYEK